MKRRYFEYGTFRDIDFKLTDLLRYQIFKRDNWTCQKCGLLVLVKDNKWRTGKLVVHHKDLKGQQKDANNDPSNLITLCNKCHPRLHAALKYQQ